MADYTILVSLTHDAAADVAAAFVSAASEAWSVSGLSADRDAGSLNARSRSRSPHTQG